MQKSFKEIFWDIPEPQYRQDPALSQSTLGRYEENGFKGLDSLYDKLDTPSLLFGSCVDSIITDGDADFQNRFFVSDIPSIEPSVEPIVKEVFSQFRNSYTNINDIPDSELMPIISQYGYQARWKPETRCKVIREKGQQYYQTMFMAGDKRIVSQNVYNKVFACVRALKDSEQTHKYFCEDNPFDGIERCYQQKFKHQLGNVVYRGMADLLICDHENKRVIPCDLKTSSHREYEFPISFIKYHYQIQARLYWRLIRKSMDNDEYFKDFTLEDFRFIVVNNIDNPNPLVWIFRQTQERGDLNIGGHILRDPETIGEELTYYLENNPSVPREINLVGSNDIEEWLDKKMTRS